MYVLMSKRIAQDRPSSCFLTSGLAGLMYFQLYYIFSHIHSYTAIQASTQIKPYTDKKENQIFLIYNEIHSGVVWKSYLSNISPYRRKTLVIYDFATAPFSISLYKYMRKIYFLFYRCILVLWGCKWLAQEKRHEVFYRSIG